MKPPINPADPALLADAAPARTHGPTWYRLSEEAWAMIRSEYLAGSTAKALSRKWRVSPGSIYRHACQEGWTKETRGEAVAAVMIAREREAREHLAAEEARVVADADPAEASEVLTRRAAGLAMAGRTEEAQALLKAAEGLRKAGTAGAASDTAAATARGRGGRNGFDDEDAYAPEDSAALARHEAEAAAEMLRLREGFRTWLHLDLREMTPEQMRVRFDRRWTDDRPPCTGRVCFVRACEVEMREKFARAVQRTGGDGAETLRDGDKAVLAMRLGQLARAGGSDEAMRAYVDAALAES